MISVLMSVYNHSDFLNSTFISVFNQDSVEFELICVDDCSSDGGLESLSSQLLSRTELKIVTNEENLGLAKSLNRAFEISKFNYIARIDADDLCRPDRFEKQLAFLKANPDIDIVGSNAMLIDRNGVIVGQTNVPTNHESILDSLEVRNPMIHPSILMRRSVLEVLGGYDDTLRKAQDLDLWHRAAKAGFKFANLPDCLISYRVDLDKSFSTIFRGFWVSLRHAVRNRSFRGVAFSVIDLGKYLLIRGGLYTPRSMRQKP